MSMNAVEDVVGWLAGEFKPVHVRVNPAREASSVPLPAGLPRALIHALKKQRVTKLYTHQREAYDHLAGGNNVIVSSSTASGKSLCYQLRTLAELLENPESTALWMFPTKALARDQFRSIREMAKGTDIDAGRIGVLDGDTPLDARREMRRRANLVLSTVDQLHLSFLSHNGTWRRFHENLRLVVVDEAHYTRGVFGSHVALLLRRLRRVCREYGSSPNFMFASATISNPKEHAERLCGLPVKSVTTDGSPRGEKHFILLVANSMKTRAGNAGSFRDATAKIAAKLINSGLQCLVFRPSVRGVEATNNDIRKIFEEYGGNTYLDYVVRSYRGGQSEKQRRQSEADIGSGELLCLVATNALELGVDIGGLDAVLMAPYPGTIASSLQQAGRCGRGVDPSVAIMALGGGAIDSYFASNPSEFFDAQVETANVNPTNHRLMEAHLLCAAGELPRGLSRGDFEFFEESSTKRVAKELAGRGELKVVGKNRRIGNKSTHRMAIDAIRRGMRGGGGSFNLLDEKSGKEIDKLDESRAFYYLYGGSIYPLNGEWYTVTSFSQSDRKATASQLDAVPTIETTARIDVQVDVKHEFDNANGDHALVSWAHGRVAVKRERDAYNVWSRDEEKPIDTVVFVRPWELEMNTHALWCDLPSVIPRSDPHDPLETMPLNALDGVASAGRNALAMIAMCDPRDIGWAVDDAMGRLYLFDEADGGVGLAEQGFRMRGSLAQRILRMIESCTCDFGCPRCIRPQVHGGAIRRSVKKDSLKAARLMAQR